MSPSTMVAQRAGAPAGHVDALLARQGKADRLLLRRRVEFRVATQPDTKMDQLRKRYTPINGTAAAAGRQERDGGAQKKAEAEAAGGGLVEASGFRRAAHSLFPAERLAAGWRAMRPIGPGLNNLGNTCFLNSVLQCLTYTAPLAEYMLAREHSAGCRAGDGCMLCRFEAHTVRALSRREGAAISPKAIVGRLRTVAKHMRVGRQEDAHEFLRLLVDAFQRSLLAGIDPKIDRRVQETTLVGHVFGGYLQSQVSCSRCGHDSNTFDPLLDVSLDIQAGSTIAKALRSFIRPEALTKSNRYRCEKCAKLVDATKQMTIYRLPRILTLQLKRFSVFGGKIGRHIEFPLALDMRSYVSKNSPEAGPMEYALYAVLVHAGGSSRSGHYYCFVKSPAGIWHELNDSVVRQVSERTVLQQSAYVLFYERKPAAAAATTASRPRSSERPADARSKPDAQPAPRPAQNAQSTQNGVATASDDMEALLGAQQAAARASAPPLSPPAQNGLRKKKKKAKMNGHGHDHERGPLLADTPKPSAETPEPVAKAPEPVAKALEPVAKAPEPVAKGPEQPAPQEPLDWVVRDKSTAHASNGAASKSTAAPVIAWNESISSKRAKAAAVAAEPRTDDGWSVSDVKANRASQYGALVESWGGGVSAGAAAGGAKAKKRRQRFPDKYDMEYDRGRVKKVKAHKRSRFASPVNPFQAHADRAPGKKRLW
ncbi:hypothetical protein H4R18_001329 [Coemansia javaensis]|uniref:Ubiquitin carboxyl-terminal hydrolase n=1 Tax=Coemansia javaensis TaxID=2761396 RepID=A0A9W8HK29_9FUNG|nr:hypothetical protein H4R18_001329 [Coemansia javaensis]